MSTNDIIVVTLTLLGIIVAFSLASVIINSIIKDIINYFGRNKDNE